MKNVRNLSDYKKKKECVAEYKHGMFSAKYKKSEVDNSNYWIFEVDGKAALMFDDNSLQEITCLFEQIRINHNPDNSA